MLECDQPEADVRKTIDTLEHELNAFRRAATLRCRPGLMLASVWRADEGTREGARGLADRALQVGQASTC